nr:transcription factor sp4 [Quercus suber]
MTGKLHRSLPHPIATYFLRTVHDDHHDALQPASAANSHASTFISNRKLHTTVYFIMQGTALPLLLLLFAPLATMSYQGFMMGDSILEDLYTPMLSMDTDPYQYPPVFDEFSDELAQAQNYNQVLFGNTGTTPNNDVDVSDAVHIQISQALRSVDHRRIENTADARDRPIVPSAGSPPQGYSHSDQVLSAPQNSRVIAAQLRPRGLTTSDVGRLQYHSPSVQVWAQESYAIGYREPIQYVPNVPLVQDNSHLAIPDCDQNGRRSSASHTNDSLRWRMPSSNPATSSTFPRPASEAGTASTGLYQCHYHDCHLTFDTPSKLRHHTRYHTPNGERKHACHKCDRRFVHHKDLVRHHLTHDLAHRPSFLCPFPICGKSYKRKDHLSRHVRVKHLNTASSSSPVPTRSTIPDAGTDWRML